MRRREGEAIRIGDSVEVRILAINGSRVKLGITAPPMVVVQRQEVELVRSENLAAAQVSPGAAIAIIDRLQQREPAETPENRLPVAVKDLGAQHVICPSSR
jgi:carbon storage regulator